jgi:phosphoglycerate kinase
MKKAIRDENNLPVQQIGTESRILSILAQAKRVGVDVLLPLDSVCSTDNGVVITNCDNEPKMNTKERDCGPATWRRNADAIHAAKTIIWNGPLGQIELPMYRNGTMDARDHVVKATKRGAITIVLGQDMVNNVFKDHLDKVTHWNNWSWPSWSLIVDKKLLGIDTLSRCDGVCACVCVCALFTKETG